MIIKFLSVSIGLRINRIGWILLVILGFRLKRLWGFRFLAYEAVFLDVICSRSGSFSSGPAQCWSGCNPPAASISSPSCLLPYIPWIPSGSSLNPIIRINRDMIQALFFAVISITSFSCLSSSGSHTFAEVAFVITLRFRITSRNCCTSLDSSYDLLRLWLWPLGVFMLSSSGA